MSPRRPLGLWAATALVVGSMIGSGIFLLPATLAPYGAASLLGWGLSLGGALLLALTYAWLAQAHPLAGGSYAYARLAFGDGTGFAVAWSYWICNWAGNAALAVAFAGSLGALWPWVGAAPWHGAAVALAALWLCTAVNLAGLREAAAAQIALTLLKLLPLLLFGVLALARVDAGALQPFNPSGQPLLQVASATAALTLWAFLGLEAATVPAEAVRDPRRTVPRATLLGVALAGIATLLACTAVLGVLPAAQLRSSAAPMADAAARLWGAPAASAVALLASVSCLGALNGWVLLQAQMPLAAARDGLFPAPFARTDARGTPRAGLLLSTALASVLVLANADASLVALFEFAILLTTAAALVPYALTAAAWFALTPRAGRGARLAVAAALAYALWALLGTGLRALLWGGVLLLAGVPVYLAMRARPRPR